MRQFIKVQEAERARIARDLHDDIGQQVAVLAIELAELMDRSEVPSGVRTQIGEIRERAVRLAQDVRALSHRLHPAVLDHIGFPAAVRSLCDEFARRNAIQVSTAIEDIGQVESGTGLALYRIAQEALRNVERHAAANAFRWTCGQPPRACSSPSRMMAADSARRVKHPALALPACANGHVWPAARS